MSMPRPTNRRTWIAAWAMLCAAGVAATAGLNASSAPDPSPEKPVSAQCTAYIADIERQLAEAEKQNEHEGKPEGREEQVLAFSGIRNVGEDDDCGDALRSYLRGYR
ncbi:hypothetical protein [Streptomyces sp. NPDC020607]|uniref:hypothetical protein n=1 Tax=Streptomyces sp. NPDC020607 TaxID=3365082 RepID=UPI0037A94054